MIGSYVAIKPREEKSPPVCDKAVGQHSSMDEKIVAFVQFIIDNFNNGVEAVKKLAQMKPVIFMKGFSALVMTPFTVAAIVKTCRVFAQYTREKKIDAALTLCEQFRRIGENAATLVVSLERIKAIRVSPIAWAKPFAGVLAALSIASIVSNVRTYMKVKRLMREWGQVEESGKEQGKMTLDGYRSILDLIKQKQKEDSDFISETFNVSEEQLQRALSSVERQAEGQLSSHDAEETAQATELLEKTAQMLKGRIKQNLVSSILVMVSSVVNLIGTTLLLVCPVLPIGWIAVGATVLLDGGNWIRHKVVDYQFAKAMDVKRTKWEWATC